MILAFITAFLIGFVASLAVTPLTIRIGRRMELYDPRAARKIHKKPMSRIGGFAIFLAFMMVAVPSIIFDPWNIFADVTREMTVLLLTSSFIFIIGLIDDISGMRAIVKLLAQILVAMVVCWCGILVEAIFGYRLGMLSWPVTILWIVGITNAVNLIDGLDGLCAGICAMTCAVIATFTIVNNLDTVTVLILAMLGGIAGFLIFNFNPAKIFMGDGGSMVLGFFIAVSSLITPAKGAAAMGIALPALALGLPIFDMFLAVVRRILTRRSIFAADSGHIHHKLIQKGLSHRRAVIVLYLATFVIAAFGILMISMKNISQFPIIATVFIILLVLFRVVGVFRVRRMFTSARDNFIRMLRVHRERKIFEEMENEFTVIHTFDQWWQAMRNTVRRMGFLSVSIEMMDGSQAKTFEYVPPGSEEKLHSSRINIPIRREDSLLLSVVIEIPLGRSFEGVGRQLSLFGRLLDEHCYVQQDTKEAPKNGKNHD